MELLSCPFCGYKAEVIRNDEHSGSLSGKFITIRCTGCGAEGPYQDNARLYEEDEAYHLWNFRVKNGMVRPKPEPRYDDEYFDFENKLK